MSTQTSHYNLVKPATSEAYDVSVQNGNMDKIDAALWTFQRETVSMFTASSSLAWYWTTPTQKAVGSMRMLSTGVKYASIGSGFVNAGTISSGNRPDTEYRFVAVSQETGESRFGHVDSAGNVAIYNPEAETYWFEAVWAV